MYYQVGWMLNGWVNFSEHIVQLPEHEKAAFLDHLKKLKEEGRIFGWRIVPISVKGLESILNTIARDLKEERS